jgi:hypothetical protein
LAVCVVVLSACGGGGSGTAPLLPHGSTGNTVDQPAPSSLLYLTQDDNSGHSIYVFPGSGSGATAAIGSIDTPSTNAFTAALDAAGNIYVTLAGTGGFNEIAEYAAGSMGSVSPVRDLKGSNTHLNFAYQHDMNVAPDGTIVALMRTISTQCPVPWEIDVYSKTANGNAPPTRTIAGSNTMLSQGWPVMDATGTVYVALNATNQILIFNAGDAGNVAPDRIIQGSSTGLNDPMDMTITPDGKLAVMNQGNLTNETITEYPLSASGNVSPVNTITGIGYAESISFDKSGNLWTLLTNGPVTLNEYAPGTTGAATPIRTIFPNGMTDPSDLAAL